MQFVIARHLLLKELGHLQGVLERKNTIPILSHIRLEATDNEVHLAATDLDVRLETRIPATVKTVGSLVIPGKKLFEIIKAMPDGDVAFQVKGEALTIKQGTASFKLMGQAALNFPAFPELVSPVLISLPASVMTGLLARAAFAMTQDESRYALNGVQLQICPKAITATATNGHHLVIVEHPTATGLTETFLLPKKAVTELSKLCTEFDGLLHIRQDEHGFLFDLGARQFQSRKLAGEFPKWGSVVPKKNPIKIELDVQTVLTGLKRVALMSDTRTSCVKLEAAEGKLRFVAQASDVGEAEEVISDYTGADLSFSFNATYCLEFLNTITGETMQASFKDNQTQGKIVTTENGFTSTYVIMPMRV